MSKKLIKAIVNEDVADKTGYNLLDAKVKERLNDVRKDVAKRIFN